MTFHNGIRFWDMQDDLHLNNWNDLLFIYGVKLIVCNAKNNGYDCTVCVHIIIIFVCVHLINKAAAKHWLIIFLNSIFNSCCGEYICRLNVYTSQCSLRLDLKLHLKLPVAWIAQLLHNKFISPLFCRAWSRLRWIMPFKVGTAIASQWSPLHLNVFHSATHCVLAGVKTETASPIHLKYRHHQPPVFQRKRVYSNDK